jgi:short-subunit dehydrogenase
VEDPKGKSRALDVVIAAKVSLRATLDGSISRDFRVAEASLPPRRDGVGATTRCPRASKPLMSKTILVAGYGPGISDAVARKFGAEGFAVALVARSEARLATGARALEALGVRVATFPTDLGDANAARALAARVRATLGPVTVLHWNAYAGLAGDLLKAEVAELRAALDVGVIGLVAALQGAHADLKAETRPAVLVTGGGFSAYNAKIDAMAVGANAMGLSLVKAAQHKLVGLLAERLREDGIYVGEVTVLGTVKGSAFDRAGHGTVEASAVADAFWKLYTEREPLVTNVG